MSSDAILKMSSETNKSAEAISASNSVNDTDWYVECSDEEVYTKSGYVKGKMTSWKPEPKDVIELSENFDKNGTESINLDWKCPGRRPLTPSTESEYSDSGDEAATEAANRSKAMDFDFDTTDDSLKMTPTLASGRNQRELTGSARKRTSNFSSILNNARREQQQNQRIQNQAKKDSRTPTS